MPSERFAPVPSAPQEEKDPAARSLEILDDVMRSVLEQDYARLSMGVPEAFVSALADAVEAGADRDRLDAALARLRDGLVRRNGAFLENEEMPAGGELMPHQAAYEDMLSLLDEPWSAVGLREAVRAPGLEEEAYARLAAGGIARGPVRAPRIPADLAAMVDVNALPPAPGPESIRLSGPADATWRPRTDERRLGAARRPLSGGVGRE